MKEEIFQVGNLVVSDGSLNIFWSKPNTNDFDLAGVMIHVNSSQIFVIIAISKIPGRYGPALRVMNHTGEVGWIWSSWLQCNKI